MAMDEAQVRALVRQAIARHLGSDPAPAGAAQAPVPRARLLPAASGGDQAAGISHARFVLARPAGEVECLIEPAVTCNHCGYCQCYGH